MSALAAVARTALAGVVALVVLAPPDARAATFRIPAGTTVPLRPLAPIPASALPAAIVLQVDADLTLGGHLVFARGALARGTVARTRAGTARVTIDWILDTSGDRVVTVGTLPAAPLPLSARIRAQEVNVPDAYDPAKR